MSPIRIVATGTVTGLIAFLVLAALAPSEEIGPLLLTPVSVLLGAFVLAMGWLVAAYSARNLRGQRRQGRFAALLAVAVMALLLVVTADPLPLAAVGWTVSGLAVAALVGHAGTPRARRASRRVAGRLLVGDAALWAAVVVVAVEGGLSRSTMAGQGWLVPALLATAGVVRSALLPAWRWLPLTAEAPSPVSALLHAGVVNGLGLLAVLYWPLFAAAPGVLLALVVVGLATAVAGTAAMRVRPDVKGRLASSTSAQMGYMAVQVGLGLPAFAMLHLVGHGFYKAWLFLRAGGAPRRAPAPVVRPGRWWAMAGLVAMAAVAAVAGLVTWAGVPLVDLVPLAVAVATGTAALAAVCWPDLRTATRTTARSRLVGAGVVLGGLTGYVAALGLWARAFEFPGVWSGGAAATLVLGVLAVGVLGLLAATRGLLRPAVTGVVVDTADRLRGRVVPPPAGPSAEPAATAAAVVAAGETVGAMWPVHSAVAVNPLAGLQGRDFVAAADVAAQAWGARAFLPEHVYADAMRAGRFTRADLVAAASGLGEDPAAIVDALIRHAEGGPDDASDPAAQRAGTPTRTLAERAGIEGRTRGLAHAWTALADADRPGPGGLWAAFRDGVRDLGLRGLRSAVAGLPADPIDALDTLLDGVVPAPDRPAYLSRLLAADPGWAARLRQRDPDLVADLLALRAVFDVLGTRAVAPDARWVGPDRPAGAAPANTAGPLDPFTRSSIWQRAWEQRYRNRLVDRVTARAAEHPAAVERPRAQVVTCIDVRSERLRRHLEAAGPYATYGFAGFFGVAFRHRLRSGSATDQCPVLLSPAYAVDEDDAAAPGQAATPTAVRSGLVAATARPGNAFAVAEGLGLLAGAGALLQTLAPRAWTAARHRVLPGSHGPLEIGMSAAERTSAAAGMLRAIGLVDGFAPVLLLVGHAATVENNAFAAAYDCGACGGHGGHVNARVMAAILNDSAVRDRLADEHGIVVPASTVAVPAWHDTTTDEVTIHADDVPARAVDAVAAVRADLAAAGRAVLAERLAELPGVRGSGVVAARRRAGDWAEPQPEWGLAGNAAFVVGPRSMTRGLTLRGRVFLHSYEPALDPDLSTLELILTAPTVVTQWINNQYYFSTVDPDRFGAGDKTTHNVMGDYGVVTGAGGDLRVGLPWQSLFRRQPVDGAPTTVEDLVHEPLRLLVLVYADPADVASVLRRHPSVADLVAHEWIALAVVDPVSGAAMRLETDLTWNPWVQESNAEETADAHR